MTACWVLVTRGTDLAYEPDPLPHYESEGAAIDRVKALGPAAIMTAAAGRLLVCDVPTCERFRVAPNGAAASTPEEGN